MDKYIDSDGQILIIRNYYNKKEYRNSKNQCHRLDGPAVEWHDGDYSWCKEGKRHRIGGPTIFWKTNHFLETRYWFIENKRVNIYYIYG